MRVQHNIMAMNSYRNYNNNSSAINKNIEKLSSGYQINRAGDNAAGLAISEKMRAQITGLEVAQKNAKDGISLVQTAEGALTEVHSMLNRMYELAEQSANGTYSNDVDRAQLQKEVASLKTEINRIADSANFNGQTLLDGSLSANPAAGLSGDNAGGFTLADDQTNISALDLKDSAATGDVTLGVQSMQDNGNAAVTVKIGDTTYTKSITTADIGDTLELENVDDATDKIEITLTTVGKTALQDAVDAGDTSKDIGTFDANGKLTSGGSNVGSVGGSGGQAALSAADNSVTVEMSDDSNVSAIDMKDSEATGTVQFGVASNKNGTDATVTVKVGDTSYTATVTAAGDTVTLADTDGNEIEITLTTDGKAALGAAITAFNDTKDTALGDVGEASAPEASLSAASSKALTLQIGDDAEAHNKMQVSIDAIYTKNLGKYTVTTGADGLSYKVTSTAQGTATKPETIADIDISSQDGAAAALGVIKDAINYVSDTRGGLGAIQNRLEHTINNLSVMQENMQDAESTIRDTDVAAEMMKYTKNSILVQSAQAMLAQANQQPQGVLQLLQ